MKSTNNSKRTKSSTRKPWHWPYLRMSDGPEFMCPHGVGHSNGVHGCDGEWVKGRLVGCCADPSFIKAVAKWKNRKS